jgi:hypothetical protein
LTSAHCWAPSSAPSQASPSSSTSFPQSPVGPLVGAFASVSALESGLALESAPSVSPEVDQQAASRVNARRMRGLREVGEVGIQVLLPNGGRRVVARRG